MAHWRRLAHLERALARAAPRASATTASSASASGVAFAFASRAPPTSAARASTSAFASTSRARGFAASSGPPRRVDGREKTGVTNADFAKYLTALVVAVVGATYASVPLYRMFCQATGFGGTTRRATLEEKLASEEWSERERERASAREITITFNADVAEGMPWRFTPTQKSIKVRPGESALAFYTARNLSRSPVTGVATYNVQPNKCGTYFNKVQCFCFEEQRLRGREEVDMPVLFYIDPEFASDPNMRDVTNLVLSYTFFKSDDFDDDDADDDTPSVVRVHGAGTRT
jgi:cytochrome c oxidase assembly protein subunit 11